MPLSGDPNGSSVLGTSASSLAGVVGIALITMPSLFYKTGYLGGSIVLIVVGTWLCFISLCFFEAIKSASANQQRPIGSYEDLATLAFGRLRGKLVGICIYLEYSLFLSVLILMLGEQLQLLLGFFSQTACVWIITASLVPVTLMKDLKFIAPLGAIGAALLSIIIVVAGFTSSTPNLDTKLFHFTQIFPFGVSIANCFLVFSFGGLLPTLIAGMREPEKFPKAILWAFAISLIIYVSVGAAGYRGLGDHDVLEAVSNQGTAFKWLLACSVVIMGIPQFAITVAVVNQGVDQVVGSFKTCEKVGALTWIARVTWLAILALIADRVSILKRLLDIISSVTCVLIVLIFPALLWWKLVPKKRLWWQTGFFSLSLLVGLVVIITGTAAVVRNSH